ncbi:phosphatase PAP2 family protein [Streptomyces ipomoeae]|uniref:phosphatase PAP2 family protein n=1 Tax=Streptomyces ipomoeae TaxID=103232 RepID=UPI0011462CC7|nr:phosphatase PAP2 family protein [Streptomyces ipomoeae]MDX2933811.1 phosphatase PAP2 family protein [Streptomyces ipomoeae]TQE25781.1 phosphatase PAP2 family protein [Streptomyces ipomoeae]
MHSPTIDAPPHRPTTNRTARAAAALTVPCVLLLALVALSWRPLMSLDKSVANTTHGWAVDEPGTTHAFRILTDWVWDPVTMRLLAAAMVIWLIWRHREWWTATWLAVTCAIGTVVQQAMKAAVGRERPVWSDPVDSAHYAAFPSGHAMTATVVCGLLLWLLHRYGAGRVLLRWALWGAVVSVVGVGLSRIWLGVHWASDVAGGWLLGALTVVLAMLAHEKWHVPARNGMTRRVLDPERRGHEGSPT